MLRPAQTLALLALCGGPLVWAGPQERVRWPARGGADGSGAADAPPVRAAPEAAWTRRLPGTLDGEPRVWDGHVAVATRGRGGRAVLMLLELESGRAVAQQAWTGASALAPSLYGDRLAIRAAEDRVDVLRVSGSRFQVLRSVGSDGPVSAPLLDAGRLVLRAGDALVAYELDRNEPAWQGPEALAFRGEPALADGTLFAVGYRADGRALLLLIDARDGRTVQSVPCGDHAGTLPPADAELSIAVHADAAYVRFPLPVRGGRGARVARIPLRSTPEGPRAPAGARVRLIPLAHVPAATPSGWLALEQGDEGATRWIAAARDASGEPEPALVLADAASHPRLLESSVPATVAGGVALLGDVAADTTTWHVLWRLPAAPAVRPVPCTLAPGVGGWLVASAPDRLSLLRGPPAARDGAQARALARGRELRRHEADALADVARRAVASGDARLVGELVAEAVAKGASPVGNPARALAQAREGLARLYASEARRTNPTVAAALAEEAARLRARVPETLASEAAGTSDPALRRALLRVLLGYAPDHAGAAAAVRAQLPAAVVPDGARFDALDGLDFLDAEAQHGVQATSAKALRATGQLAEVARRELEGWRADLVVYRTERLAVVTPPGRPGTVARALAAGELVCDALEDVFEARARGGEDPLVLLLYTSPAEYRTQSQRDRSTPEVARGWTSGHFDGQDNLSRLYLPDGEDGVERMLGTVAHELAHHWLATRSPFAAEARRVGARRERPGFWIVEGFANLIGELDLDLAAGTWRADSPRAESLDALQSAPAAELNAWDALLSASKDEFDRISPEQRHRVPLTWRLGGATHRSDLNLFYDQAGALAQFLFAAEGGRHRAVLLDALTAYYTGEPPIDVAARLRLPPEALGAAVQAYARERVGR